MAEQDTPAKGTGRHAVSWIFALIWIVAVSAIASLRVDIPLYMLLIATVFFIMLVPSMNDLVRDYERIMSRLNGKSGSKNPDR